MSGRIVRLVPRRHACPTPGWWQRRKLAMSAGTVWECSCGERWEWRTNYAGSYWLRLSQVRGWRQP